MLSAPGTTPFQRQPLPRGVFVETLMAGVYTGKSRLPWYRGLSTGPDCFMLTSQRGRTSGHRVFGEYLQNWQADEVVLKCTTFRQAEHDRRTHRHQRTLRRPCNGASGGGSRYLWSLVPEPWPQTTSCVGRVACEAGAAVGDTRYLWSLVTEPWPRTTIYRGSGAAYRAGGPGGSIRCLWSLVPVPCPRTT